MNQQLRNMHKRKNIVELKQSLETSRKSTAVSVVAHLIA